MASSRRWSQGSLVEEAIFLDYDGTLREFENWPEAAVPTPDIRELLEVMNTRRDILPHIISGRNAHFLERHFGDLDRFTLIAEKGHQMCKPSSGNQIREWQLWHKDFDSASEVLYDCQSVISDFVFANPGSHMELKSASIVWHYREMHDEMRGEASAHDLVKKLEALREKLQKPLQISSGHKIVEISAQNVTKGEVMLKLCQEQAFKAVLACGDDLSDETMFVGPHDAITIKVGEGPTQARFRAESPKQLRSVLMHMLTA